MTEVRLDPVPRSASTQRAGESRAGANLVGRRDLLKVGAVTTAGSALTPRGSAPSAQAGERTGVPLGAEPTGLQGNRTLQALEKPVSWPTPAISVAPAPGLHRSVYRGLASAFTTLERRDEAQAALARSSRDRSTTERSVPLRYRPFVSWLPSWRQTEPSRGNGT